MDSTTVQRLSLAWMRRKRWEADLTALAVVGKLGEAMAEKKEGENRPKPKKFIPRVSGGEMLAMMGVRI